MIDRTRPDLSVVRPCELLGLHRSGLYYQPVPASADNLALMRLIDEQYLRTPFYGSRQMTNHLTRLGHAVNRKRVQRLMALMGLQAVAPGPHTSQPHPAHPVYPYRLRGMTIDQPNQVWAAEIVCTQMTKTDLFAARVGGNHIPNLDVGIGNDHPIDQKFDQLPFLLEAGVSQARLDPGAEVANRDGQPGDLFMPLGLGRQLALLFYQRLVSLFQFLTPSLVLG